MDRLLEYDVHLDFLLACDNACAEGVLRHVLNLYPSIVQQHGHEVARTIELVHYLEKKL